VIHTFEAIAKRCCVSEAAPPELAQIAVLVAKVDLLHKSLKPLPNPPLKGNRAKGIDFDRLGWPLALIFAAGIAGIILMAYLGDKLQCRILLASVGFLVAGAMVYIASSVNTLGLLVLFFAIAVFFQSAYGAQEYAIVQRLLPPDRVGAGTGLYNGLSVLFGGVGGSLIPGSIVATTGSFDAGILSIVVGALLAASVMFVLARTIKY
jgi:MFS family permease